MIGSMITKDAWLRLLRSQRARTRCRAFAAFFEADNPRFDYTRFRNACQPPEGL